MRTNIHKDLDKILNITPGAVYGFLGNDSGEVICESGDIDILPWKSIVEIAKSPESISSFYLTLEENFKNDPRLTPLIYSQGESKAIIAKPFNNHIIAIFGVMPKDLVNSEKASWTFKFKKSVSTSVESVFPVDNP